MFLEPKGILENTFRIVPSLTHEKMEPWRKKAIQRGLSVPGAELQRRKDMKEKEKDLREKDMSVYLGV